MLPLLSSKSRANMQFLSIWICYFIGITSASYTSPPSVITEDVTAEQDQAFFASCSGSADSTTDIYWFKPGGQRVRDNRENRIYSSYENGLLLLVILEPGKIDEGEYICQEVSDGGETTVLKRFSFQVLAKTQPHFEKPYEFVEAFERENVTLTCEALGDQPIEYSWIDQHSSSISDPSSDAVVIHRGNRSELHLPRVSNKTSGVYTCVASNQYGKNSKLFELVVHRRENDSLPVFNETSVEVYGFVDEPLILNCQADGKPRPTYVWYNKYGEKLDRFHQRVIDLEMWNHSIEIPHKRPSTILVSPSNGTLVFVQLKRNDDGHYRCYARNSVGQASKVYRIYVNESEGRDSYITAHVRNVTHDSVTFALIAKDDSAVSGFDVKYRLVDKTDWLSIRWMVGEEHKVTGLLPGAKYSFQFRIVSRVNWTDPIVVALPPGPPEIIIRQVAPNKINMEFFRPIYMFFYNSTERYIIKYRTVQQVGGNTWKYRDCEVTIELPACYGSSYEISNLSNRVYYSVTVQAVGPGGYSELSEIKIYMQ